MVCHKTPPVGLVVTVKIDCIEVVRSLIPRPPEAGGWVYKCR